jgi:hypothetical protein
MANKKFSEFTLKTDSADVSYLVGFTGSDNVRIDPSLIGGGGSLSVSVISSDTNAVVDTLYVMTASLTLTLPASPSAGDKVLLSNRTGTTTSVVARNGNNIQGLAQDLTVDALEIGLTLVYTGDATQGWVII